MDIKTLETLGISKERITELLLDRLVEEFMTEPAWDEDGEAGRKGSSMAAAITSRIQDHVNATVQRLGDEHVLPRVTEIVEGLVIQQTNKWGEKTGKPVTFIEYLVSRADAYMREDVDRDGKSKDMAGGYSWVRYTTRIAHMVDKHLQFSIEKAMTQALKDANASIAKGLNDAVKMALAEATEKMRVAVTIK